MKQKFWLWTVALWATVSVACDGGLTVPYVSLTVQSTSVSDSDLKKLQSESGALFAYSVPAFVTADGKGKNQARISFKQKRNFRFSISCTPRSFLTFDRWTANPASNARIFNPDSQTTLVQLTGDCVITATFKRHKFLLNYTAGNAASNPVAVCDEQLNSLYQSLAEAEKRGIDLSEYPYPTFSEKSVLIANPDYPDYKSLLDFMAGRGDFAGVGLDRNGDGRIHFFSDGLTAEDLNRFFFGSFDEKKGVYRGFYAGLLFFGDRILSLADGATVTLKARPDFGADGSFVSLGWQHSGGLVLSSGGAVGDTQAVYSASGDGVCVYQAVCEAVAVEARAVKAAADAIEAAEIGGRVQLKNGTVTVPALSTVTANGSGSSVSVAENEKIALAVAVDADETFVGWLFEDDSMLLLQAGESAEVMPLFTDYSFQTASRIVTAVFMAK